MTGMRSGASSVVVVGSAMVDLITYVDRMPLAGETMLGTGFLQDFGGKGANQAAAVALHGVACSMVGCVGDDLFGPATIDDLVAYGVDTTHLVTIHDEATGTASIFVEPSGENRIALAMGANRGVDEPLVVGALDEIAARTGGAPAVLVSQLETPQDATAAAFEWARDRGATTVLTPGPALELSPRLAGVCDWFVPNETELAILLGLAPDHPVEDALRLAASFATARGVGLAVTVGAAGAVVVCDGALERVAAPPTHALDTTGAGDAFAGAFAAGLAEGTRPLEAARLAVAFASDSVTRPGTRVSYRAGGPVDVDRL
jgi:ribokinase